MTTQTQDEERNPFPEPQTIPCGWDMSEFLSAPTTDSVSDANDSAKTESC